MDRRAMVGIFHGVPRYAVCFALFVNGLLIGAAVGAESHNPSLAKQMVAEALRAEVAGDAARHAALLDRAIEYAPNYQLAHWQRGEIEADGQWLPVEEAQRAAAANPRRAEYLRRREASGDGVDAQLALARWCRRNNLDDETWFHSANVVSVQPWNEESLRALGMRWHRGRLLTYAEIDQAKRLQGDARRAAKRWKLTVTKWQRAVASDFVTREEAMAEIRALADGDAIPALEQVTLGADVSNDLKRVRCRQVSRALVDALSGMPGQAATESLIRHALFSAIGDVREAAIAALRERPSHDYVPMLLDALAMPIESSFRVATDTDGSVHYWHSLFREGRYANRSFEGRLSAMQHDLQGGTDVTLINGNQRSEFTLPAATNRALIAEMARVASVNQSRFGTSAGAAQRQIAQINQAVEQSNARIMPLLAATTGQDLGDSPREWWDWWDNYNEYYSEGEPPVYEERYAEQTHRYYRPPRQRGLDFTPRRRSCFAAGTLVWTNTGQRAIETLQIGDFVLAQDVDSGELAYKPVVGRTVRPPTETVKLSLDDDEELQTTLGHPLWVAGIGWRMAKLLGDDAILHGVDGPVRVAAIKPAGEVEAFNLIVAEFNTYFVGESGVLVHDNTPRRPTTATLPGLAAK